MAGGEPEKKKRKRSGSFGEGEKKVNLHTAKAAAETRNRLKQAVKTGIVPQSAHVIQAAQEKKEREQKLKSEGAQCGPESGGGAPSPAPGGKKPPVAASELTGPSDRYSDLGGIESQLVEIKQSIHFPFQYPQLFTKLGTSPPTGILLHGPPGCGKTKLALAIAGEIGRPFYKVAATELVTGVSGESEAKVRKLFQSAQMNAPSLIFIDEIDSIAGRRDNAQREMERRISSQLQTCMDELQRLWTTDQKVVMVIGTTSRVSNIEPALRRAGRFDREISMGIPDEKGRHRILEVLTKVMTLGPDVDLDILAHRTPGYVGSDLASLARTASGMALERLFKQSGTVSVPEEVDDDGRATSMSMELPEEVLETASVMMADFEGALKKVQPSSLREGFTTIPNVTWENVGAMEEVKEQLTLMIQRNIEHPELFEKMGITATVGVLLYGPPGCGKTLVAKAVAAASGANFISIKGPELLNKYVGESEKAVRTVFSRAKSSAPCILFFDELDALAPKRSGDSSNTAAERVVNQLLTEMDGVQGLEGVYIIAATNRKDIIDDALLRPGRLGKQICIGLPDEPKRVSILQALSRSVPVDDSVNLKRVAERCKGFSGADLAAVLREASMLLLQERFNQAELRPKVGGKGDVGDVCTLALTEDLLNMAASKVKPSVSKANCTRYES